MCIFMGRFDPIDKHLSFSYICSSGQVVRIHCYYTSLADIHGETVLSSS